MRRGEKHVDQKSLSISALKNDYLYLDSSVRATEISNLAHSRCSHCGGLHPNEKCLSNRKEDWEIISTIHFSVYVTLKINAPSVKI